MKIHIKDKSILPFMHIRGLPNSTRAIPAYDLTKSLLSFMYASDYTKTISIDRKKQLTYFDAQMANIFDPYLAVISGVPNDAKARLLGAFIMQSAIKSFKSGTSKHQLNTDLPLWVNVTGGYKNTTLDRLRDINPSMLILSNICKNSTDSKLEKVCDLIAMCDNIPRIVVAGGDSPLAFAYNRLYHAVNFCYYLGNSAIKRQEI